MVTLVIRSLLLTLVCAVLTVPVRAEDAFDLRNNAVQHAERGILYLERSQPDAAIDEFLSALKLNPGSALSASLYNNLGLSYRAMGNHPLAVASFQHAIRLQPNYALYYKNLIETYARGGDLSEARRAFEHILSANPDNTEALFLMGLIYQETHQQNLAKETFQRFLKLEPHSTLADAARSYL